MAPLLAARQTILLVSGAHKRAILRQALTGPITPAVPASYLQRAANVTVIADRAAWPGEG
jgi:glucosamine-6-phosphate deaminase